MGMLGRPAHRAERYIPGRVQRAAQRAGAPACSLYLGPKRTLVDDVRVEVSLRAAVQQARADAGLSPANLTPGSPAPVGSSGRP